jgi:hypothetical protein
VGVEERLQPRLVDLVRHLPPDHLVADAPRLDALPQVLQRGGLLADRALVLPQPVAVDDVGKYVDAAGAGEQLGDDRLVLVGHALAEPQLLAHVERVVGILHAYAVLSDAQQFVLTDDPSELGLVFLSSSQTSP